MKMSYLYNGNSSMVKSVSLYYNRSLPKRVTLRYWEPAYDHRPHVSWRSEEGSVMPLV